jgi:hypothetical protein
MVHHKTVLPTLRLTVVLFSILLNRPFYSLLDLRLAGSPPASPGLVPSARGLNTGLGAGIQRLVPGD